MFRSDFNTLLYRGKTAVIVGSLTLILYTNIYLWAFLPFTDFEFNWQPDSKLHVYGGFDEEALSATLLQEGDLIIAIDGKPVNRAGTIYSVSRKDVYEFIVDRGGETLILDVPFPSNPGALATSMRLPSGILSIVTWLVAVVVLHFAYQENHQALHLGYQFLLMSVFTIGIQGALLNVPGAWLLGPPLMTVAGVGWIYLGFIPRSGPLGPKVHQVFKLLYVAATAFALTSIFENLFLFPRSTSFEEMIGLSLYDLGLTVLGTGLLSTFIILTIRAIRIPKSYAKQQLIILLFFIGLGILPAVLLTFLPNSLFGVILLPFPISLSLLILVPAGYFFVIYRRGYLGLDLLFGRILPLITLAVVVMAIYGAALYIFGLGALWDLGLQSDSILSATVTFLPVLVVALFLTEKRVNNFINRLLFGLQATQTEIIPQFTNAISLNPEFSTIQNIVQQIAKGFNVNYATLVLSNEQGYLTPIVRFNKNDWRPIHVEELTKFNQPLIRSAVRTAQSKGHPLFDSVSWIELLLPVVVRNEQIGFLAMSRPAPDGYYNAKQISFLAQVTDIIAVGSVAISRYESTRLLLKRLSKAQRTERRKIASQIHDRPLQDIDQTAEKISDIADEAYHIPPEKISRNLKEQVVQLDRVSDELRQIMTDLFPPSIELGLTMVIRDITREFREGHDLDIELQIQVPESRYFPTEISMIVYQVMTEALNNVVKHAHSTDVCVSLTQPDSTLTLTVADQGKGCNLPTDFSSDAEFLQRHHFGIVLMMEAAQEIGGTLSVKNNVPRGTIVNLEIPLNT